MNQIKISFVIVLLLFTIGLTAQSLPSEVIVKYNGEVTRDTVTVEQVSSRTYMLSNGLRIVSHNIIPGEGRSFDVYRNNKSIGKLWELSYNRTIKENRIPFFVVEEN